MEKKSPLEAEDRISKHNSYPFQTPQKSKPVDPDLIQLKNAEIDVLRHQISRLELRIQEECQRNADMMAYRDHHHLDPPIAVAECTTANGTTSQEYEFRMLRDEIRHLQYQLSRKNNATTTSGLSTTGSTLSSLENENEEEEEGDEEVANRSSWYSCCVRRRSRRGGYGRVTR
jgi:hypothetical protein